MTLDKRVVIGILVAGIVCAGALFFVLPIFQQEPVLDARGQSSVSLVLTENGFEPRNVRITQGTKVIFSTTREKKFWPASNTHPAHDIYPEFDPKRPLEPGETWSFVFDRPGTWYFHCHIRSYFNGAVYVEK